MTSTVPDRTPDSRIPGSFDSSNRAFSLAREYCLSVVPHSRFQIDMDGISAYSPSKTSVFEVSQADTAGFQQHPPPTLPALHFAPPQ